jgi:hypothetical protein
MDTTSQQETCSIDSTLIDKFREKADEGHFCYFHYSNINGINQWHCICSAMDWISVAVDKIEFHPQLHFLGYNHDTTLTILSLLMRVAMLKEGIEQLHRVLFATAEVYLKDDCSIWGSNPFGQTDNEYFETLRSCFGVHPINLKGFKQGDTETKRFASWPYVDLGEFEVMLYPQKAGGEDITISMSFDQLEQYAIKRYSHLNELIEILDKKLQETLDV